MIIKNGNIALPGNDEFASLDIEIDQAKLVYIGENLKGPDIIDASGLQIFPGAIDPHVHFNEPGYTEREDFYHGTCAAASGGVTTVIDMPCTSIPPATSLNNLQTKLDVASERAIVDFGFFGGVSKQSIEKDLQKNMRELADFVLGYKTYLISGMETFGALDPSQIKSVLTEAGKLNRPVLLHAEDPAIVNELTAIEKQKGDQWINFYRSRPESAEISAIEKAITVTRETKGRLHIVHVGTGEAALMLKSESNVSGETAPHYLEFSYEDLDKIGGALKTVPVVKAKGNAERLWECLMDGTLAFIASDHAPAPAKQKNTGSAWDDYSGIPGTGTLFPYLYSEGLVKRQMPLSRFLQVTTENAAKQYGLWDRKGSIEIGKDADLIFVDPNDHRKVKGDNFLSKGKITPFENRVFHGKIKQTMLRGNVIYNNETGINVKPGYGQFIRPGKPGDRP
jgi:allantoinase